MSHAKHTRFNVQISEEASEWFVEFRLGEADARARADFAAWIRTSPEHLRAYLEVASLWSQAGSLGVHRDLDSDALIALACTEDNVIPLELAAAQNVPRRPGDRRIARLRWLGLAAALVLAVLGGAIMSFGLAGRGTVYATTVGERRVLRLEDGSSVELNSRSRIRVLFAERGRTVDLLEGQALFHVAKDPRRPFIVRNEQMRVRAVGTEFDINRRSRGTTITVVEGRVSVAPAIAPTVQQQAATAAILLSAGEQVTVRDQTALSQPLHTSPVTATAWTEGRVVLESATLTEVGEDFNRYSTRRLIVEDRGRRALRLSGVFATDPEFLLRYLRQRPDITIEESATEVRILRRD
jgi:transmembrane sensor